MMMYPRPYKGDYKSLYHAGLDLMVLSLEFTRDTIISFPKMPVIRTPRPEA